MNQVLLIARYQFLMARRTMNGGSYISIAIMFLLLGFMSYFLPFNYLLLSLPLVAFYIQNSVSRALLHIPYELDAGYLSIYPISQQKKFNLLLLVDFFHVGGIVYALSFVMLIVFSAIRFSFMEGLFLIAVFTVYWLFFATFFLCIRTFCRRNSAYFYVIRISGSLIAFAYIFGSRFVRNYKIIPQIVDSISPISFLLYSIAIILIFTFIISRWFMYYVDRHPFADPQLADKFVNRRWK